MRDQLKKFTEFASTLLPNETAYLLSVQQFKDSERLAILQRADSNAHHIAQFKPYDLAIDKRKYNHLQNWIQARLHEADVDEHFSWMLDLEQKITTDTIRVEEEKALLKSIRTYQHPAFFFVKFYELVNHYRHFLLIRLRYSDHAKVEEFLQQYREAYEASRAVNEKLHDATLDIVGQYAGQHTESSHWEAWLTQVFYDETIDGQLRYLALVRLTFIAHNYRRYELLPGQFDYLDRQLSQGQYYSRRLLLNYYNNRLMLHAHFREYDKAVYYGYLATRTPTHDYLLYVNNLCAVLLRTGRNHDALELMKRAAPELKNTKNFHNRVGFVAFYMEALNKNGLFKNAESYGNSYLRAYAKEVLEYRWHLFFTMYLEALLRQNAFDKALKIVRKYRLSERDKDYSAKAKYLPVIPFYIETARLKEGLISQALYRREIQALNASCQSAPERQQAFEALLKEASTWVPELRNG